ncbi:FAS1 domain [Sesbania bispinosa]|nr:FAS1 domain [Sesbania bispinosa]
MRMQQSLISTSILLLALTFYSITTSAQLSPIQPPTSSPSPPSPPLPQISPPSPPLSQPSPPSPALASPPATAPAPGFNTVPLLVTSGSGGLTLFAPEDSAFSKLKAGFLNSLSDRQKVELLQFHTLSSFISISNFDTLTNPVQTQAGDDAERLQLNVTTYGGSQVDKVLLPLDLVLPAKSPAAAPALAKGLPKSGKTNSSATGDSSAGGGDDSDSDGKDCLRKFLVVAQ